MSIFTRLLKRNPEDGGSGGAEQAAAPSAKAEKPAAPASSAPPAAASPAPAKAAPPPAPAPATAAPPAVAAPPAAPVTGTTKAYVAPAKAAASPGTVPSRPPLVRAPQPTTPPAAAAPPGNSPAPRAGTLTNTPPAAKSAAKPTDGVPAAAADSSESLEVVIETMAAGAAALAAPRPQPELTETDRKAVLATFEDVAVAHLAQVRNVMLEVRWGEAQASWIELARPALRSLRAMADRLDNEALTAALDRFDAAVDKVLQPGAAPVVSGPGREALLAAYEPLIGCLPRAFELDGERERREPLIVRALLQQAPGLDPLMIDKMLAAGLGRLEALARARAEEIAAVAGIPQDAAAAAADHVAAFRRAVPAALATPDQLGAARELEELLQTLQAEHRAFEEAAGAWSDGSQDAKRRHRRRREVTFLQITIALARLGEIDLAVRLEKMPFARRLDEIERFVRQAVPARPPGVIAGEKTEARTQAA
jgi:hypothetical protein